MMLGSGSEGVAEAHLLQNVEIVPQRDIRRN